MAKRKGRQKRETGGNDLLAGVFVKEAPAANGSRSYSTKKRVASPPQSLSTRLVDGFGADPLDPYGDRPCDMVGAEDSAGLQTKVKSQCPPVPGVYGMFDRHGELIYVGKSRSLRHRLMSYFGDAASKEKAGRIIEHSRAIQWETQPSDFAAQLRELDLIRRWAPRFNVQGVPQRQRAVYLCLGRKPAETFFLASTPPTTDCVAVEGPFFGLARMRDVVDALNKTFQLRDCSQQTVFQFQDQLSLFDRQPRPGCLRLEIGTCLGPCAAACTRDEYLQRVSAAESFLDGFNDEPLIAAQELMESASANQQYELASRARDTMKSLAYATRKLSYLSHARRDYSFVYAATGYDACSIWYLIRSGEIIDVVAAPKDREQYQQLRPKMQKWSSMLKQRHQRIRADHPHSVAVVSKWFRKHRGELKQTFQPEAAGRRYHRLSHHRAEAL
ncbi:MAG: GIY-YIG nuclease family protein [Rhodopirellula sp. JB055]|uniref:GIY-YIG nuclease family protein n=1 Tax=Rhodopirellula sp. JB055 TaxID=3342846 RepID=UPI00370B41F5